MWKELKVNSQILPEGLCAGSVCVCWGMQTELRLSELFQVIHSV